MAPSQAPALDTDGAVSWSLSPTAAWPLLQRGCCLAAARFPPSTTSICCPSCSYVNVVVEAVCSERFQEKGDTSHYNKLVINASCCLWPVVPMLVWLPGNDCMCIWFLYLHLGVCVVHLCNALWMSPQRRAAWKEVVGEPRRQNFASVSRASMHMCVWVCMTATEVT